MAQHLASVVVESALFGQDPAAVHLDWETVYQGELGVETCAVEQVLWEPLLRSPEVDHLRRKGGAMRPPQLECFVTGRGELWERPPTGAADVVSPSMKGAGHDADT